MIVWAKHLISLYFLGATHLLVIGAYSYILNSHKRLLTGGPLFLQKVIWPFMCTVVRRAHFFFYAIFHLFLSYGPKPHLNLPTPPPFHLIWPISTQDLKEHLERKCVYSLSHTHTHKNQNQAFHWNNRELSLALSSSSNNIFIKPYDIIINPMPSYPSHL